MTGHAGYDELPDGVVVADADGRVTVLNLAATRLTGIRAGDALGRQLDDVLPLVDARGRDWWACTSPYSGLGTRVRQPEVELELPGRGSGLAQAAELIAATADVIEANLFLVPPDASMN